MPIRLQIILLALVSLLSLGLAFFFEFQNVRGELKAAENSMTVVDEIAVLSRLIHPLQKERGLSAGHLVEHNAALHAMLVRQRQVTDIQWSAVATMPLLNGEHELLQLPGQLRELRPQVDAGTVGWQKTKHIYSSAVERLLTLISLKLAGLEYSDEIAHPLQSIAHLAEVRENLGLLRANLTRAYRRGRASREELLDISHRYGSFVDEFRLFQTLLSGEEKKNWLAQIQTETFESVIRQIKAVLGDQPVAADTSPATWWREATLVIDTIKQVEDEILNRIVEHASHELTDNQQHLLHYGLAAASLLLLAALLAASMVQRILRALSILIRSLRAVEQTQDFGLRIQARSRDEFGQIGYSINRLLGYIDQIIREKDHLATTDLLTGLQNRRSFIAAAEREIKRSRRYGTPLSLIFCDIDHFKCINDSYGHATGDRVLHAFAEALRQQLRDSDQFARWGGEEFIVLAPETTVAQAVTVAEKLREATVGLDIAPVEQITCSFGVAMQGKKESFEQLCERTDQALYQAKAAGRNQVCIAAHPPVIEETTGTEDISLTEEQLAYRQP